jgi:hypothetical protein
MTIRDQRLDNIENGNPFPPISEPWDQANDIWIDPWIQIRDSWDRYNPGPWDRTGKF